MASQETQDQPPLWEYVTKLEKQGAAGGVWKFQCNLCSETRQGSYSRVRAHLLGIKGSGIAICKSPTAGDRQKMKQLEEAYEEKKAESNAKEVALPCEAGVGFKKRKGSSTPIERAFGVEIRDQLDQEIARMFYTGGLPFNLARNPHYLRAFQFAAANKIDGYVPPGYNKLRTTLLQKEKDNVHRQLEPLRSTWKEKGVTIVSDGWSDPTRKPLINFMATSGNGPLFLKAVNCFGEVKDRFFIADLMKEVINESGHQNVNICSPNNVETNALAYEQWQMFTPLILLSVAGTRFASITVMLKRLKLIKTGLQAMVISEEWSSYRDDDTVKANFVKEKIVNDDMGRDKVSYILSFTGPIYEMIRACDTDKPCLHLVYEMWDSMIEKVKIEIYKKEKRSISQKSLFYDVVHGILVARWAKNNTPLHCLAHSLNPRYYSDAWLLEDSTRSAPHRDAEISQERINCFRRLFPNDDEHSKVLDDWWVNFGAQPPFLQTLAFRLLGQPSSSSCAERNWSTYAFIHSLRRNKLTTSRAQDLVYIHNNLRLLSRNPNDDVKMWDVGGDAFDSMEDVGL
ncbi:hAT dimerization domain, ribonuclease H-like domain protein [Tanacetum coccineum]